MAKGNGKKKPNGSRPKKAEPKAPADAADQRASSAQDDSDSPTHTPDGKFAKGNRFAFPPGQSGNPKGRPPKPSLVDAICRKLREAAALSAEGVDLHDEDGKRQRPPNIDEVAEGLLMLCMGGDREAVMMLTQLLERLDGKVPAKLEHTGRDGDAIEIRRARDDILSRIAGQVARSGTAVDPKRPN